MYLQSLDDCSIQPQNKTRKRRSETAIEASLRMLQSLASAAEKPRSIQNRNELLALLASRLLAQGRRAMTMRASASNFTRTAGSEVSDLDALNCKT